MLSWAIMIANPYAVHVGAREPRDVVETTVLELHRLVGRIGTTRLAEPRAPGKWSARDILCHLADCEIAFAYRLRQALAEDHHVIQPFNQSEWARNYAAYDTSAALDVFTAVRNWNVRFIRSVPAEAHSKPVTHPERGALTFKVLVESIAGHDVNHLKQIEAIAARQKSAGATHG